jgi:hypothetical protein
MPKSIKEANVCGDGICGATEDCNNCPQDCGCKSGEYCSNIGICRENVCGDGVCSNEENMTHNCCEDCSCTFDKICNKVTENCQEKINISEGDVTKIANDYMNKNSINGTIIEITDAYYKNETIKQVNIDCRTKEIPYPCQIVLYINSTGKIVEEMRTA